MNQLNLLSAHQARLQQQAATGQRLRAPEDDPAAKKSAPTRLSLTSTIQSTDAPALQKDEDNLIYQISNNGAAETRLETAATIAGDRSLSLQQMISKEADADLTDTMVQLSQTQNAYQAALQSGALIMQTSLLDYLR